MITDIIIRKALREDTETVTGLFALLYFDGENDDYQELYEESKRDLVNPKMKIFLAFHNKKAVGLCHTAFRCDYVEGTKVGNVGYLEAIYVKPEYRNMGIAKKLVEFAENWAREGGCSEFASDCLLENTDSYNFHLKIGFKEANRLIHFVKKL